MDLMEYQAKELFAKHDVPVTLDIHGENFLPGSMAYLVAMIVSFHGQGLYTFSLSATSMHHFVKFAVLSVVGLSISALSVVGFESAGASPYWGVLLTSAIVPLLSFQMMKFWVFKPDERAVERAVDADGGSRNGVP